MQVSPSSTECVSCLFFCYMQLLSSLFRFLQALSCSMLGEMWVVLLTIIFVLVEQKSGAWNSAV
ncbi:hypothetical protein TSMEX_005711 [Taenia solium]|eukprot:TsM_000298100 transcript=TsM_000298100 gene=TsM_000298100